MNRVYLRRIGIGATALGVLVVVYYWFLLTGVGGTILWENVIEPREERPDLIWAERVTWVCTVLGSVSLVGAAWAIWNRRPIFALGLFIALLVMLATWLFALSGG